LTFVHCVSRSGKEIVLTLILESHCIADNVIQQANLENMGAAFVILFLAVLQAEMLLLPAVVTAAIFISGTKRLPVVSLKILLHWPTSKTWAQPLEFFSSCPTRRNVVTSGLGGRHIYFRYKATSGCVANNIIPQLDLENMGVAVGILFLHVVELQISAVISQFYRSTDYFRFWSRHLGFLV